MANFLSPRVQFPVHMIQLLLVIAVLILSVVRMFTRPSAAPRSRAGTMSLGMSAKSLIILLYELLSSHVGMFKKWASLKTYLILNALEIVFWGAVVFLTIQANVSWCSGIYCTLGWIIVVLSIFMSILAAYMTIISYLDFRYFRDNGSTRGSNAKYDSSNAVEIESIDGDTACKDPKRPSNQRSPGSGEILIASQHHSQRQSRSMSRGPGEYNPPRYESFRNDHRNKERRHSDAGLQNRAELQSNHGARGNNAMSYNAARFNSEPYSGYGAGYEGQQYYQEYPSYGRQGGY